MRVIAMLVMLLVPLAIPSSAQAETACQPGAFQQADMAGAYESFESQMRVTVYPCGGIDVLWSNVYGTHQAGYYGAQRIASGGIVARLLAPDPYVRSLDGRNALSLAPAEPGYVKVMTLGPFGDDVRLYRLAKQA